MRCLKCCHEIQEPVCPRCGFSHQEGALLLGPLPDGEYEFCVDVQLSETPGATELWKLVQYAQQGHKEACQTLADYYFSKIQYNWLLEIRRDISEYRNAKQVSVEITRAAYWVKKLLPMKGTFSPGQKYLLALELMLDGAAPSKCFRYLEEAAKEGFRPAVKFLVICLETGWCCKKDLAAARAWESKLYRL